MQVAMILTGIFCGVIGFILLLSIRPIKKKYDVDVVGQKRRLKHAVLLDHYGRAHHSYLPSVRSLRAACSLIGELNPTYDPDEIKSFCSKCRYIKGDWNLRLK